MQHIKAFSLIPFYYKLSPLPPPTKVQSAVLPSSSAFVSTSCISLSPQPSCPRIPLRLHASVIENGGILWQPFTLSMHPRIHAQASVCEKVRACVWSLH